MTDQQILEDAFRKLGVGFKVSHRDDSRAHYEPHIEIALEDGTGLDYVAVFCFDDAGKFICHGTDI